MSPMRPDEEESRHTLALAATIVYGLFVLAAVLWLWLRGRQQVLPQLAVGEYGATISMLAGLAVGLLLSGLILVLGRYLKPFKELEARLAELVGDLTEPEIIAIAMASAIGEEMFFRGALQDCLQGWGGPYVGALIFGLLHIGPRLLLWSFMAVAFGLVLGLMVHYGFGLLSVTVAHALINFISLRRMCLK